MSTHSPKTWQLFVIWIIRDERFQKYYRATCNKQNVRKSVLFMRAKYKYFIYRVTLVAISNITCCWKLVCVCLCCFQLLSYSVIFLDVRLRYWELNTKVCDMMKNKNTYSERGWSWQEATVTQVITRYNGAEQKSISALHQWADLQVPTDKWRIDYWTSLDENK